MNEKLYDALEVCLNALETGADPKSVLMRFPDLRDDLAPLLHASRQARLLAIPEVPEKALQRGKAKVLQHAARMRKSAPKGRSRWSMFAFPRLATALAIALVFLFSGTGLVHASSGALPGDNLYPVKRTWEDVRLLFTINPENREELEIEFEDERLHEVNELLVEGRHETITFQGLVTEQIDDQWMVSRIAVQITPDSKLPLDPVAVGASIIVRGRTNVQGFVEAESVELLVPAISLPEYAPTQIEGPEENDQNENSAVENQDDSNLDEMVAPETSSDNQEESTVDEGDTIGNDDSSGDESNNSTDGGEPSNNDGSKDNHDGDNHNDNSSGSDETSP